MCRAILSLILISLVVSSCAPLRPDLGPAVSQRFADDLFNGWYEQASQVTSVQGVANVSVKAPMNNMNVIQVILAEKPGRLRAETLSPFGVSLMTFVLADQELTAMFPARNLLYKGFATAGNIEEFINLPLEAEDLVNLLLGQPSLLPAETVEAFTLQEGGWLLARRGFGQRQELVFNNQRELSEVALYDGDTLQLVAYFENRRDNDENFPTKLRIEVPGKYAEVSIEFTDLELNKPIRDELLSLHPPQGYDVIQLPN